MISDWTVNGDDVDEINETYFVVLSNPQNAGLAVTQGTGTIFDDDASPTVIIDDVTTTPEGALGVTTDADFTVTLSGPSTLPPSARGTRGSP